MTATAPAHATRTKVLTVKKGMAATYSAAALLQTYYNVIESTPIINLPAQVDKESNSHVVENLPKYQHTAIANAKYFMTDVNPMMIKTLEDIIGFKNEWSSFYNKLLKIGAKIDEGQNAAMFSQAMTLFQKKVIQNGEATKPVIEALNGLLTKIEADERNLKSADLFVTTAMGGEQGEIQTLQSHIDALHEAIKKDNDMIAGGAAMMVAGAVVAAVGVVADIATVGAATALVVGGVAVAVGGAVMTGYAGVDLKNKTKDLKKDLEKLSEDKQVFGLVKNASKNIGHMKNAISGAIAAVENLQDGWNGLGQDFGEIVDALKTVDPSMSLWLKNELEAADKDWTDTYNRAKELLANGTIKVKKQKV